MERPHRLISLENKLLIKGKSGLRVGFSCLIWYNHTSLPGISRPYREIYDGSFTINIDREGNVLFKPLDGEEIKGKMIVSQDEKYKEARVTIEFENGLTSHGKCRNNKEGKHLYFLGHIYYLENKD